MKKIGKPFSRDMEFTGSCEAQIHMQSRLLQNLQQRGFNIGQIGSSGMPSGQIRGSMLSRPEVMGYMEPADDKTAVIDLTDDQKQKIEEVTGWAPSQAKVTVSCSDKSQEVELTDEQKAAVEEALGIEMSSITVERDPIEVDLK